MKLMDYTAGITEVADLPLPDKVKKVLWENGIKVLTPPQAQAISAGLLDGDNVVVVAPTASGKTLIAELALTHKALQGYKGIYTLPLKALASEKYAELKKWSKLGLSIGISTGDYESSGEELRRHDIIVTTYERMDSLLRQKPSWLKDVGVVVIDELHYIGDPERGPIIEMIAARCLRRGYQIVGLSATIGNPGELASWLKAKLVISSWRPVKLVEGGFDRKEYRIYFDDGRVEDVKIFTGNPFIDIALTSTSNGHQVLAFIHNRRLVEDYARKTSEYLKHMLSSDELRKLRLLAEKILDEVSVRSEAERLASIVEGGVAFHHAGLSPTSRNIIENAFRQKILRIIYATPTLSAGVNLPARRVLVSIKRYEPRIHRMTRIKVLEYKQMAGRAGRPQYDELGEAIVVDERSARDAFRYYVKRSPEPIYSALNNERSLRIYSLALVASNEVSTLNELIEVFKETLYSKQRKGIVHGIASDIKRIIYELSEWGMLNVEEDYVEATKLGKITSSTYLDPLSARIVLLDLKLKKDERLPEQYYLHLASMTPDFARNRPYISRSDEWLIDNAYKDIGKGIIPKPPDEEEYEEVWLQAYKAMRILYDWIEEKTEDYITMKYGIGSGDLYNMKETMAWITSALARILEVAGLSGHSKAYHELSKRIEHGVRGDLLELVEVKGIGRVRARALADIGIRTVEDLLRVNPKRLVILRGFGPKIVEEILRNAREYLMKKYRR